MIRSYEMHQSDACSLDDVFDTIDDNNMTCKCPPAYFTANYETVLSLSAWPTPR